MPTQLENGNIRLNLKREVDDSYEIVIGSDLFPRIARDLKDLGMASRYAIVTDSNVLGLYAGKLEKLLADAGLNVDVFSFPAGEQNKNWDNVGYLVEAFGDNGLGRDSAVISLGGGVVGDMAGFAASLYCRDIPCIQVPTTLLAQADSSVGGKTGADLKSGKNLVGRIEQPRMVYIDVATLRTLSDDEFRNGLAETIKHGILADAGYFEYLDNNMGHIRNMDGEFLLHLARTNCRIKGTIVEQDPGEKGMRQWLNLGHTPGHAIEKLSNYTIPHGQAVSMGLMVVMNMAQELHYMTPIQVMFAEELLQKAGLPVNIPAGISTEDIIAMTLRDKKARDGKARYVLPAGIGKMQAFDGKYSTYVDTEIVRAAIERTR